MTSYACLRDVPERREGSYVLKPVDQIQMEQIRCWRNEQLDILRQAEPLSTTQQLVYYNEHVASEFAKPEPQQLLFSLVLEDKGPKYVGYGGLTHINWTARHAELSFLSPRIARVVYREDLHAFLGLSVRGVAFEDLNLHRVWHETFDVPSREQHLSLLTSWGFECEGRLRDHALVGERWVDSLIHGIVNES